jgi:hypothetical protein
MRFSIEYSVRRATVLLLAVTLGLVAASVAGDAMKYAMVDPPQWVNLFQQRFNLDDERNIPTWFSSFQLLSCALIMASIGSKYRANHARFAVHWCLLAAVFTFLSIDEAGRIHELLVQPMRTTFALGSSGFFRFAWVIPYVAGAGLLGLTYISFLRHLPRRTRGLFIASGLIYVGAAAGLEMVEGWWATYADTRGQANVGTFLLTTTEESLEMLAMVLFFYTLSNYAAQLTGQGPSATGQEPTQLQYAANLPQEA